MVVDDLWHEFILYTKAYDDFCKHAFGQFLHHTPAVVLGPEKRDNEGLRRVWWYACKKENINPTNALRLPLLFALDAKLGIADGFVYAPDCKSPRRDGSGNVHCGSDFSDRSPLPAREAESQVCRASRRRLLASSFARRRE